MYGSAGTKANESWTCNTLSYSGNPSTSEKYLPCAYAGNLRLHLSHPLGKVQKKERNCKECKMRTRECPGLRQPKSTACRGEAGGKLQSHKTESELLKQLLPMKRRRRRRMEERQALVPSHQAWAISLQCRNA